MHRELAGDGAEWTLANHLLAAIVDALHTSNWQRGGDAKAKRPKRITRPGVADDAVRKIGSGARSLDQIDEFLASFRDE